MDRKNSLAPRQTRSQTPTGAGRRNHRPNGTNPDGSRSRSRIRSRGRSQQLVPSDNKPSFRSPPSVIVRNNDKMMENRRRQMPPSPHSFRNKSLTPPHRQYPLSGKPHTISSSKIYSGTRSMSSPRLRSTPISIPSRTEGISKEKILGMMENDDDLALHDIFKKFAIQRERQKSSRQKPRPKER
uniref:Uncharacterized protein n=1 Tax=Chaetoceros debilis TaxID=122233 RepID=A0A7S3PUY4_9STRA|mmetsp:Transcript_4084/g.6025  ORF Transcript_4084/g.6025 Transcript_4084/m.6025 type:complete len:184 (+) Transcript_4084:404-955(+)